MKIFILEKVQVLEIYSHFQAKTDNFPLSYLHVASIGGYWTDCCPRVIDWSSGNGWGCNTPCDSEDDWLMDTWLSITLQRRGL